MIDPWMWSRAIRDDREREAAKRRLVHRAMEPRLEDAAPARRALDSSRQPASRGPAPLVAEPCCVIGWCA